MAHTKKRRLPSATSIKEKIRDDSSREYNRKLNKEAHKTLKKTDYNIRQAEKNVPKKIKDKLKKQADKEISKKYDLRQTSQSRHRGKQLGKAAAEKSRAIQKRAARMAALAGAGKVALKSAGPIGGVVSALDTENLGPRAGETNPLLSAGYKIENAQYDQLTPEEKMSLEASGGHDFSSEIQEPQQFQGLREFLENQIRNSQREPTEEELERRRIGEDLKNRLQGI